MRQQAELGEYFAFDSHLPTEKLGPAWQPLVLSDTTVATRVEQVGAALAASSPLPPAEQPSALVRARVAASVTQLGMTARLISPVLGMAVVSRTVLELTDPHWKPSVAGVFALSLRRDAAAVSTEQELIENLASIVSVGIVRDVVELTVRRSVSPAIAWGNVTSAVNGAAVMLALNRPDLADRAGAVARAVLTRSPLAGTWTGTPISAFQRRSCCLIYRLAGRSATDQLPLCGDCVLAVSLHGKR